MNIVCIIDHEILTKEDDVVVTQCGHLFHRTCITEWLASSRTCPNCRQTTATASLIKLFLENDDNKSNDLHNELLKSNEQLSKELDEFRDKANAVEKELIDTKVKYRALSEKVKNLERTKQIDDMMLASLRTIKEDSAAEIVKLNRQMSTMKLDLLAEKELRRIHQQTLHKLDPLNENYDLKNVSADEGTKDSSYSLPWLEISIQPSSSSNSVKKDQNYVIPSKIQKANNDKSTPYNFNYKRSHNEPNGITNSEPFRFSQQSRTNACDVKEGSTASPRNAFIFGSSSRFSSPFRFGTTSSPLSSSSNLANDSGETHFANYRDSRNGSIDSPRASDR